MNKTLKQVFKNTAEQNILQIQRNLKATIPAPNFLTWSIISQRLLCGVFPLVTDYTSLGELWIHNAAATGDNLAYPIQFHLPFLSHFFGGAGGGLRLR